MADTETISEPKKPAAEAESPEKKSGAKAKGGEKKKPASRKHLDTPPIHDMVIEALETIHERKGVSLVAIKRYLEDNYKVDTVRQSSKIRHVIISGVDNKEIIRTRGNGCQGRFKVKPQKPLMIKKRRAPEDYVELPNTRTYRPSSTANKSKKKVSEKEEPKPVKLSKPTKAQSSKGKRGRPKKK